MQERSQRSVGLKLKSLASIANLPLALGGVTSTTSRSCATSAVTSTSLSILVCFATPSGMKREPSSMRFEKNGRRMKWMHHDDQPGWLTTIFLAAEDDFSTIDKLSTTVRIIPSLVCGQRERGDTKAMA